MAKGIVRGGRNDGAVLDGDAAASDVRKSKTFYNTDALVKETGTADDNGSTNVEVTTLAGTTIPTGFSSGAKAILSATEIAKVTAENVLTGVTLLGVAGSAKRMASGSGSVDYQETETYFNTGFAPSKVIFIGHADTAHDSGYNRSCHYIISSTSMVLDNGESTPVIGMYTAASSVADNDVISNYTDSNGFYGKTVNIDYVYWWAFE